MALREDQVQRYGRQILLKELGGRGQRALLAAPVEVRGAGAALSEAVAYLAAGGSPLRLPPGFAPDGFLAGAAPAALSPDVDAPGAVAVRLRTAGAEGVAGPEPEVVVASEPAPLAEPAVEESAEIVVTAAQVFVGGRHIGGCRCCVRPIHCRVRAVTNLLPCCLRSKTGRMRRWSYASCWPRCVSLIGLQATN